jgi:single-stranded-DNA-specific exonuclease
MFPATATSGLQPSHRWQLAPRVPPELTAAFPQLHPALLRAIHRRGIHEPVGVRAFLDRTAPQDDDPFRMAGMFEAVARLKAAIRAGEPIAVYGDFDADGVTATALLVDVLRRMGADARHFIPHRERDGYGVHAHALAALADAGVRVVVTVDCGIRSSAEVAEVARRGVDVIVTDHHVLPETLPEAVAVLNPRRPDCGYGFTDLAGVGLAFKLAQGLLRQSAADGRPVPGLEEDLLDLVALGTVADVVPLVGENRHLVHAGLAVLARTRRPGLRALMAVADLAPQAMTARGIGFGLGPRLNAAGRMDDADSALALLLAEDAGTATELANELELRNQVRRQAMTVALEEAERRLAASSEEPLLFYHSPNVPLGVVGLVAGRLAEHHYRPAVVVRTDGELARGSARSVPEFDITAALSESADLLVRFGGHSRAAGFTVRSADLLALEERLIECAASQLSGLDLRPTLHIDAEVGAADITWGLHESLAALEPTGEGNPPAVLLWRAARIASSRTVGNGHLKLALAGRPDGAAVGAIGFGLGDRRNQLGSAVDVAFSLHPNTWNGQTQLELRVIDLAPPSFVVG